MLSVAEAKVQRRKRSGDTKGHKNGLPAAIVLPVVHFYGLKVLITNNLLVRNHLRCIGAICLQFFLVIQYLLYESQCLYF